MSSSDELALVDEDGGRNRQHRKKDRKNVPVDVRDARIDAQIASLIGEGRTREETEQFMLDWNASQPSPMHQGLLKKRIFLAYQPETEKR